MSKRVSPPERIRSEIEDLFAYDRTLAEVLEVARLSVRLVTQAGVEAEVTLSWAEPVMSAALSTWTSPRLVEGLMFPGFSGVAIVESGVL